MLNVDQARPILEKLLELGYSPDQAKKFIQNYSEEGKINGSAMDANVEPDDTASNSENGLSEFLDPVKFYSDNVKQTEKSKLPELDKVKSQDDGLSFTVDNTSVPSGLVDLKAIENAQINFKRDKPVLEAYIQEAYINNPSVLRNITGSSSYSGYQREDASYSDLAKSIKSTVGNTFPGLSQSNIDDILKQVIDNKAAQEIEDQVKESEHVKVRDVLAEGADIEEVSDSLTVADINSHDNKEEVRLAFLNKELEGELTDSKRKELEFEVEKLVSSLYSEKGGASTNYDRFFDPRINRVVSREQAEMKGESSGVIDMTAPYEMYLNQFKGSTRGKLKALNTRVLFEEQGYAMQGKELGNYYVGNEDVYRSLKNAGFEEYEFRKFKDVPLDFLTKQSHILAGAKWWNTNIINNLLGDGSIVPQDYKGKSYSNTEEFIDLLENRRQQSINIAAKKEALWETYHLNRDVTNIDKGRIGQVIGPALETLFGPTFVAENFPKTNQQKIDAFTTEVMPSAGITEEDLTEDQQRHIERDLADKAFESAGSLIGLTPYLVGLNKAQAALGLNKLIGGLRGTRYIIGGKNVSQARAAQFAAKYGKNIDDYVKAGKATEVTASNWQKFQALGLTVAAEEIKMSKGLDVLSDDRLGFETGVGAGFALGGQLLPYSFKNLTKYNALNTALDLTLKNGPAFAIAAESGEAINALIKDFQGKQEFKTFYKNHWGDYDENFERTVLHLMTGSALGMTHLKKNDIRSYNDIAKFRNAAQGKIAQTQAEILLGKDVAKNKEKLNNYMQDYMMAESYLERADQVEAWTDPIKGKKLYDQYFEPLKQEFAKAGKQLDIELTDKPIYQEVYDIKSDKFVKQEVSGLYTKAKNGKPAIIRINTKEAKGRATTSHESLHAYLDLFFESKPELKKQFRDGLKNTLSKIEIVNKSGEKTNVYEEMMKDALISSKEAVRLEEMMTYTAEFLSKKENRNLVETKAYSRIASFFNNASEFMTGKQADLYTDQSLINMLGRYAATGKISELKGLDNYVSIGKQATEAELASRDLAAQKQNLIEANKELFKNKPEGWEKIKDANVAEIKAINKNIEISDRNEKNIRRFKEGEAGEPLREAAASELLKDNTPIIETWFNKNFKKGLDVSESDFRSSMMEQVAKIMNSYNNFDVPFGYYLSSRLGPQLGNILRRAQAGRTTDIAMSEMSMTAEELQIADTAPELSRSSAAEGPVGRDLVKDLNVPENVLEKVEEKISDLDVSKLTYKTLKDLAPEFTNELLGVEPKAGNLGKQSVANAQKWFSNSSNARLFIDALPEGTIPMEGAPEAVKGTATGVQNVLLKEFYSKGGRAKTKAGATIQNKIKNITPQQVKDFFGIKPDGTFVELKNDRGLSQKVKAAVDQLGKAWTNQAVRKSLANNPETAEMIGRENLLNQIMAGKSESLAAKELQQSYKDLNIKVDMQGVLQDVAAFVRNEEAFLKSKPDRFAVVKDYIESATKNESKLGQENEIKFTKEAKKLPYEWAKNGSYQVSTAKFKQDINLLNEFRDNAFDLANVIPLEANSYLGNAKMIIDLFTGHYSTIRGIKEWDKVNSPFKQGIKSRLTNNVKSELSPELQQRWKDFRWDKLRSSYASEFYTGLKKVYKENSIEAQKAEARKFVNSENGKLQIELYDLWNTTLQEWVNMSDKNSPEYNNKMNFVARIKKHNSNLGTSGERVLAPAGYFYLPGKVVEGTFKFEHLKSSSEQSFDSLSLIAEGMWSTKGIETLKKYRGIWGMLKDFNMIDAQTGKTNSSDIHRFAESLELAKDMYSTESNLNKSLYEDIVSDIGIKEVNKIMQDSKTISNKTIKMLKDVGLASKDLTGGKADRVSKNVDKAIALARKKNKEAKGMSTFDFDETLIIDGENFVIAKKGNQKIKVSSGQWPIEGPKLAEQGFQFDFSDFVNVRGGKDGPLLQKMKNQIAKYGPDNVFVLTARMQEAAGPIHAWLKSKGINIPLKNITGLGKSQGEAKAQWMLEKFAEGYNDMYFVDDALPNVEAVKKVLDQLDIKSNVQQALASKDLSGGVNDIMSHSLNIAAEKVFSKAEAKVRGADIKRRRLFMTDGAADFELLLEPLYGKGRKGIKNKEWFLENIIKPFERGYNDLNNAKQKAVNEYMELRKQNKDVVKSLDKEVEGTSFTNDMALRVYIWNKNGIKIPDLAKATEKRLVEYVRNNPDLQGYAEGVSRLTGIETGLKEPSADWWSETLAGEIGGLGEGISRAKHLAEFIEAKNEIFSEENLNKMESKLGTNWRRNLEDMLDRMETGRTRSANLGEGGNAILNYLNGSVGTIMNFNTRSAMLQLISNVNFINHSFNNPLAATRAFANQPQYWKDFMTIMNSNMLKQRRAGLQINVTEAELAAAAAGSKNPAKAVLAKILKAGYAPTKIADSFAIASGGATYYRNAIRKYMKEGLSKTEAEKKAFVDFQAIAERTQQSSRPDLLSAQQVSVAGRIILPFANTPMQMNRIMMKELLDLKNGRYKGTFGDNSISNKMSKVAYYGFIQSAIFAGLQSGLYALTAFGDDEELKQKKKVYAVNTIADSFLRGMGIQGAVMAGIKNAALEFQTQNNKGFGADYSEVGEDLLNISPTIGSKFTKLDAAGNTYKYNKKKILAEGLTLDGPAMQGLTMAVEAVGNVPVNRLFRKIENIRAAMDDQNETYQRVLVGLGWSKWDVGIGQRERAEEKAAEEKQKKAKRCIHIKSNGSRCKNTAKAGDIKCYAHK